MKRNKGSQGTTRRNKKKSMKETKINERDEGKVREIKEKKMEVRPEHPPIEKRKKKRLLLT